MKNFSINFNEVKIFTHFDLKENLHKQYPKTKMKNYAFLKILKKIILKNYIKR